MRLLIALEQRFLAGADGGVYCPAPQRYKFWAQYLEAFDEVVVLARMIETKEHVLQEQRADGPGVTFVPLPNYVGPAEYFRKLFQLRSAVRKGVSRCDAYILFLPGAVGDIAIREIGRLGRKYAVQVLADPWDGFSPGAAKVALRPVYRHLLARGLRKNCGKALALSYVTKQALQARYPPPVDAYCCSFSDVSLEGRMADKVTVEKRRERACELVGNGGRSTRLGFAGSLAMHSKGADVFLEALCLCLKSGLRVEAHLAGDGRARPEFEALARKLGISASVHFHGHIPALKDMVNFLDSIDIFVMPSRVEGLPRALVEAMARGCPCIASAVGGIPELLLPDALVPPAAPQPLADAIKRFALDRDLLLRMIDRNVEVAQDFRPEVLGRARSNFLNEVRVRLAAANLPPRRDLS